MIAAVLAAPQRRRDGRSQSRPRVRWRLAILAAAAALVVSALATSAARAAIAYQAQSTASGSNKSPSVAEPSGAASGEVEIASIGVNNTGGMSSVPSGWTLIAATTSSGGLEQFSYYHVIGSSESSPYTWGLSSRGAWEVGIAVYSGVSSSTPVDVSGTANGASGNATAPSVTTKYPLDLVAIATSFLGAGVTAPSGTTQRWNITSGSDGSDEADFFAGAAGATATKTATPTGSDSGWVTQTIALAPAAGGLTLAGPSSQNFGLGLNGQAQSTNYTIPLTVDDETASGSGWNLTITSTQFTTGGATPSTLSTSASSVTATSFSCTGTCVNPVNSVTYPVAVPAGSGPPTGAKFFDAASGSGSGPFTVTPTVKVSVPTTTVAGTYTSTVTLTLSSGP